MQFIIREEIPADYKKISLINDLAFKQTDESKLITKLRNSNSFIPKLSIIAEIDNEIVGHILFTKIQIISNEIYDSLALAPMAVLPEFQNRRIGSALVRAGLKKAKDLKFKSVIVLGHKNYYPKLGFQKASNWQIKCPFEVPDEAFMAIELIKNGLDNISGIVQYPKAFY